MITATPAGTQATAGMKATTGPPTVVFGPYRSHFLSKKSLIAAKNETKEERRKEEEETPLVHVN
jgi:hypothetical protein